MSLVFVHSRNVNTNQVNLRHILFLLMITINNIVHVTDLKFIVHLEKNEVFTKSYYIKRKNAVHISEM